MGPESHPTVAVVIPLYNGAATIAATLTSVLSQSRPVDEVVVVDDGSQDDGAEVVARLFPAVRIVRATRNGGVARARNTGVSMVTADLVAFLDQDDLWLPSRCERLAGHFRTHPEADAVVTGVHVFAREDQRDDLAGHPFVAWVDHWARDEQEVEALTRSLSPGPDDPSHRLVTLPEVMAGPVSVTTTYALRRSAFLAAGGCATWLRSADDWVLLQTIARAGQLHELDDRSVLYRVHGSNTSVGTDWGVPLLAAAVALRQGRGLLAKQSARDAAAARRLVGSAFMMDLLLGVVRNGSPRDVVDATALTVLLAADRSDVATVLVRLARTRLRSAPDRRRRSRRSASRS